MSSLADVFSGNISLRTYLGDQLMHGVDSDPLSAGFRAQPRSPLIEDRRNEGPDYTVPMRKVRGTPDESAWADDGSFQGYDPMVASPLTLTPGATAQKAGDYPPSFQPIELGLAGVYMPPPAADPLQRPVTRNPLDLPPIDPHLPMSPGDPGWTPALANLKRK